jgi:hypothetical protein
MKTVEHFAVLDGSGRVVFCGQQRWRTWFFVRGGEKRSLIKRNLIGSYLIETCFNGHVSVLESEQPCFWRVRLTNPPNPSPSAGSFLGVIENTIDSAVARDAETISEVLTQEAPIKHELSFATIEDGLEYHRRLIQEVRKNERLHRKEPEKAQELLAELGDWCTEKRGRQSEVARAIGATPQAVNDWLNGRKNMTGEQALRVRAFMQQKRRSRS